eukprot:TRINITY_DN21785_c0_g1_i6.p1 TRINITY_DN21785_c0_g1~~TRINITY_DN21785_c0_g1_i6.p1  ORF type:complete len:415 (+),score=80.17 TRINITY_DN21785_c0_g1_i6:114-1358(+)
MGQDGQSRWRFVIYLAGLLPRRGWGLGACPSKNAALLSSPGMDNPVKLTFSTAVPQELSINWISPEGMETTLGTVTQGRTHSLDSAAGHAFRLYAGSTVVKEYVAGSMAHQPVVIEACEGIGSAAAASAPVKKAALAQTPRAQSRSAEFEALADLFKAENGSFKPCPEGTDSALWSCVRHISKAKCEARHNNDKEAAEGHTFGFDKPQGNWPVGTTEDHAFDAQQPLIPVLTDGPGFLLMNFTQGLRDILYPWFYEKYSAGEAKDELPINGGYLNDNYIRSSHLSLDFYPEVHQKVYREMQDVIEWWCQRRLEHSATFGVRVYKTGHVLISHVDVAKTHVASAVIQVDQKAGKDQGWPLEVITADRECYDVYLQPGQMVLYEGARLKHGRTMKFEGDYFANIFSHFRPTGRDEL